MRAGSLVTGEHLQGRTVTRQSLGVWQQQLEAVTTAPSTRSLHVTVLVIDWSRGRGVVGRVPGGTDGDVSELFTGLDIRHVIISGVERLQLDGTFWLDDAQELEVVAGINVVISLVFPPPGVLLNLYSWSKWFPALLRLC